MDFSADLYFARDFCFPVYNNTEKYRMLNEHRQLQTEDAHVQLALF